MRLRLDAISPHLPLNLPDLSDQITDMVRHPTVTMVSAPMLYLQGGEAIARHRLTEQQSLHGRTSTTASSKCFETSSCPEIHLQLHTFLMDALHCAECTVTDHGERAIQSPQAVVNGSAEPASKARVCSQSHVRAAQHPTDRAPLLN